MKNVSLQPVRDFLLVEPLVKNAKPPKAGEVVQPIPEYGTVIRIGLEVETAAPGDEVLFRKFGPLELVARGFTELKEGQMYLLMSESDLIGVVEKANAKKS